jgi:hypothetical protein
MLKVLKGVLSHNKALKEQYKLSPALIREIEMTITKAEGKDL